MTGAEYARKKIAARSLAYYYANREEILEKHRKARAEAPQSYRQAQSERIRKWRAANPEHVAAYNKQYREAHREEINAKARERMRLKRAKPKEEATA